MDIKHRTKRLPSAPAARRSPGANARGATRARRQTEQKPIRWGRVIAAPAIILGLGFAVAQLQWQAIYQKVYLTTNRPLGSVKIEGEFRFVGKAELKDMILPKLDGSFIDLDLGNVKHALESNPWIDRVTIERIWPDSLKLKIMEHKPIARWKDKGFVSREGEVINVATNETLRALPLLSGEEENIRELAQNYLIFTEILRSSDLTISGLQIDEKKAWTLLVAEGFSLVLGREDIHGKLENFLYVYETYLKKNKRELARVDMRYERGLAVRWKDDNELVAAYSSR